jgi:purine-binding chemotaxis protein CheW
MRRLCTFYLDDMLFGIDVDAVQEVLRYQTMTPVPLAPTVVAGLINLRGQIVTILDLGIRLGLGRQEIFEASHNIILKTSSEMAAARREGAGDHFTTSNDLVGFLVDAIGDVVEADESTIEPPSANVSEAEGRFLSGVIKTDGGLLVLLDIREVLHGE